MATTEAGMNEIYTWAKKLISHLPNQDKVTSFTGLRATIEGRNDFIIEASKKSKGVINVAGIKSPGLSAAAAIAEMVLSILQEVTSKISPKLEKKILNLKEALFGFNL